MSTPEPAISLHVIYVRNDNARQIIAGFASAMPIASEMWEQVDRALADVPAMGAVIARLTAELAGTRMDRANLLAAMRATIAAQADGEPDPLYYLRDELDARQARSGQPGGIMTGYRQMRRQARQARRAGMQPMMVINSGDPFPELAIVVIARFAWRYRSELAPVALTGALAGAGAWLHAAHPGAAAAVLAGSPGRRVRGRSVRQAGRPAPGRRARLRRRGAAGGRGVAGPGRRARPADPAAPAVPGDRRSPPARCRGGRTAAAAPGSGLSGPWPRGRTSPARSGWPARRSCPRRWTCGDGGRGSAWHADRPSPMSWPRFPRSNPGSAPSGARSASTRPPTTWRTVSSCGYWTATRTPTRSRGQDRPSRLDHRAGRTRPVRGRRRRAGCCSCAGTRYSADQPGPARAAGSTC